MKIDSRQKMGTQNLLNVVPDIPSRCFCVWLTGLPCAGKTTIAELLSQELITRGVDAPEILDGDGVRAHISKCLGFSQADREANILRIGWVCQLLTKHGVPNIAAVISPYREVRNKVRGMVESVGGVGSFVEVWVRCSIEECIRRDVKGLYAQALRGEIQNFTGITDPYEEPVSPQVIAETDKETPQQSVAKVLDALKHRL